MYTQNQIVLIELMIFADLALAGNAFEWLLGENNVI